VLLDWQLLEQQVLLALLDWQLLEQQVLLVQQQNPLVS
jgi:hypothetical protein